MTGKVKNSIPMIVLHDAFDLKKGKNGVNEINENAGLKQLSSLDTSNLNTSRIIASPEQEDADERNNQLLNNTLDISPIRIGEFQYIILYNLLFIIILMTCYCQHKTLSPL